MANNIDPNVIMELQRYLINLRSTYPSLPAVYPTGVYDNSTRNAVLSFQNIMGLPETGIVDFNTWNTINVENEICQKTTQLPASITVSPANFIEVKLGDEKEVIYAIKVILNSFFRRYANYDELDVTNLYDEAAENAIKLFQQRSMLPVTGIVDKETWNTLVTIHGACRFYL